MDIENVAIAFDMKIEIFRETEHVHAFGFGETGHAYDF